METTAPGPDTPARLSFVGAADSSTRLAQLGLAGLLTTSLLVCLSATRSELLLPTSLRPLPASLAGPLAGAGLKLGLFALIAAFALMFVSYAAATRAAEKLTPRTVLIAILALHAIAILAPPLFSSDVFSYAAYGRWARSTASTPTCTGRARSRCRASTR